MHGCQARWRSAHVRAVRTCCPSHAKRSQAGARIRHRFDTPCQSSHTYARTSRSRCVRVKRGCVCSRGHTCAHYAHRQHRRGGTVVSLVCCNAGRSFRGFRPCARLSIQGTTCGRTPLHSRITVSLRTSPRSSYFVSDPFDHYLLKPFYS